MWAAADLLEATQLYHFAFFVFFPLWISWFSMDRILPLLRCQLKELQVTYKGRPAILLVLSLELRETDFDLDCPYRLPPP